VILVFMSVLVLGCKTASIVLKALLLP